MSGKAQRRIKGHNEIKPQKRMIDCLYKSETVGHIRPNSMQTPRNLKALECFSGYAHDFITGQIAMISDGPVQSRTSDLATRFAI